MKKKEDKSKKAELPEDQPKKDELPNDQAKKEVSLKGEQKKEELPKGPEPGISRPHEAYEKPSSRLYHHDGRRGSYDYGRSSTITSMTLVSHALREVVSDHIMAGPHGALQPMASLDSLFLQRERRESMSRQTVLTLNFAEGEFPVLFEDAIAETGHGCFQYKLMALCGFVYSCCSLSTTTLSFVLPAAQWDFQLTSIDKGVLNTAPLWGMVVGAYIWGNFADSKGRKFVLLCSLLIDAFAAFVSSLCQNYTLFFICRIFNGFSIIGATSIVFAYLGEFLDYSKRDRYLSRLELYWTFGIIALPLIGFAILPRDWNFDLPNGLTYNAWRIFVVACGIPSLIAALMISCMPESPRFLYLTGQTDKTRDVLVRMYVSNTGNRPEDFPVKVLHNDAEIEYHFAKVHGESRCGRVKRMFGAVIKQHRCLLRGHSLFNILVACFIDFSLMSVYYTFILWVPEILHRHEEFLAAHPGEKARLCTAVGAHTGNASSNERVDYHTLLHTLIVCIACLPSNIILLFAIQYVSKKALLICLMVGTACPTFGLYFMETEFELTTMLCLFEALATLVEAVLFCAIVEIFPLSTRGSALSLTVTIGRIGAILGNVVFGLNLETNCRELFFGMSGMMVLGGLSALLLPQMRRGH